MTGSVVNREKNLAIVLAAGSGSRMHSSVKKQFIEIGGKPIFYYSLAAFEQHPEIDAVYLVLPPEEQEAVVSYLAKSGLKKLKKIVLGGKERYHSVHHALQTAAQAEETWGRVLIHDSARPMLDGTLISTALDGAGAHGACVVGVPVKDTIKLLDEDQFVAETPDRSSLWAMQTPQAFSFSLVWRAYSALMEQEKQGTLSVKVTDDAMVVETFETHRVKILQGDYKNIKITTPEDLILAEYYLGNALSSI